MNALRHALAGLLILGVGSHALAQQAWNSPMGQPGGGWAPPGMGAPYGMPPGMGGMPPGMAPPYGAMLPPGQGYSPQYAQQAGYYPGNTGQRSNSSYAISPAMQGGGGMPPGMMPGNGIPTYVPQGYGYTPQGYGYAPQGYPQQGYPQQGYGYAPPMMQGATAFSQAAQAAQTASYDEGVPPMESGEEVIADGQQCPEPAVGWGGQANSSRLFNHNPFAAFGQGGSCDPRVAAFGVSAGQIVKSTLNMLYFRVDALMLRRHNPVGGQQLVIDNTTGRTLLDTGNLQYANELGQRYVIGIDFTERSALELTYWQNQNWNTNLNVTGVSLSLPGDVGSASPPFFDFVGATNISIQTATRLRNLELNWIQTTVYENWAVIAGYRQVTLFDYLQYQSFNPLFDTGIFQVTDRNRLYGGQIGFRYRKNKDRFTFEFTGKSGAYSNFARQLTYIQDFGGVVQRGLPNNADGANPTHSNLSVVSDVNVNGVFNINNFWSVRLGYYLMWIENIALAPNNLDFTANGAGAPIPSSSQLFHDAPFFTYGVNGGLEAHF